MAIEIVTDSEVIPREESYDRTIVYKGYDNEHPDRLARVKIVIHRTLERSQASVEVRTSGQWYIAHEVSPDVFWWDFPGYKRWAQKRVTDKSLALANRMVQEFTQIS